MASFEMAYDQDEDVLEVTFEVVNENVSRTIPLNDHIFVHADLMLRAVWGLTFYSFSRLLGVSETEFTSLRDLTDEQVASVLRLLAGPPASLFFVHTDPGGLIARIRTPRIEDLVEREEY